MAFTEAGSTAENTKLRSEILNLFQYMQRMRVEIAHVTAKDDDRTPFESASEHLDVIVESTEVATNGILEQLGAIDNIVDGIRAAAGDGALLNGPQIPGEEISQEKIDRLFA